MTIITLPSLASIASFTFSTSKSTHQRRGKKRLETTIYTKNKILEVDWDKDSEVLAILCEGSNIIYLWQVFSSAKPTEFEVDSKLKVSFIKWSLSSPVLAIGAEKGYIFFYNRVSSKKQPTFGKHGKRIISGEWNPEGLLVTGSEDKIIAVTNLESEAELDLISIKHEPRFLRWAFPTPEKLNAKIVTGVLQQKTFLLYNLESRQNPIELVFESKYGKIIDYTFLDEGSIIIAFSEGYIAYLKSSYSNMSLDSNIRRRYNERTSFCDHDRRHLLKFPASENRSGGRTADQNLFPHDTKGS